MTRNFINETLLVLLILNWQHILVNFGKVSISHYSAKFHVNGHSFGLRLVQDIDGISLLQGCLKYFFFYTFIYRG